MKRSANGPPPELLEALRALRLLVREIGGNYLAGLQADVARVEQAVLNAGQDRRPGRRQLAQLAAMRQWLEELDVKPHKGRRRDLKELDQLIGKLSNLVETW